MTKSPAESLSAGANVIKSTSPSSGVKMKDDILKNNGFPLEDQSNLESMAISPDPGPVGGQADADPTPNHIFVVGGWQSNAARLAEFCYHNLVNRNDAFGKYRPLDERDGKNTAFTVRADVTLDILQEHFRSGDHSGLIGLHSNSIENSSRWLVIDIDHHGPPDESARTLNEDYALASYDILTEFGMKPLLCASNGLGGYHIWLIFQDPVVSAEARRLGLFLAGINKEFDQAATPEVFPKQDIVKEGGLGNWVRLPGLHHTREFCTQVWDGTSWLDGEEAIDLICGYEPVSPEILRTCLAGLPVVEQFVPVATVTISDDDERPIHQILRKLKCVKKNGIGFMARCPAHGDSTPSLSIKEEADGKVLLHCFAECKTKDVLSKIGLEMKDLFPLPNATDTHLTFRQYMPFLEEQQAPADFKVLQDQYSAVMTDKHYKYLAENLGVDSASLRQLGVGRCVEDKTWAFPEKNGDYRIVGILKRSTKKGKTMVPGSKRGLYIPNEFDPHAEHIFITEGASDTAAAISCGLNAVGVPSAGSGIPYLIKLLKEVKGVVYVVSDNDPKRDGSWPGRSGALKIAEALAAELYAKVKIAALPMEFKDIREYVKNEGLFK